MPVTARLSKLFYGRFGEQIANELVDWFNAVDATYRADLRELNELNFARFDSKLEQRMSSLEARLETRMTALEASLEQRVTAIEFEQRMSAMDTKLEKSIAGVRTEIERGSQGAGPVLVPGLGFAAHPNHRPVASGLTRAGPSRLPARRGARPGAASALPARASRDNC